MALIGYARVSTEDQVTARQLDELCAAGCTEILEEHACGGDRGRPVLAQTLARLQPGDTLVVISLDRLACGRPGTKQKDCPIGPFRLRFGRKAVWGRAGATPLGHRLRRVCGDDALAGAKDCQAC
jgi:hypothetical protein